MFKLRKCGSCFRFEEDWRDVEAKGFKSQEDLSGMTNYSKKPRKGIKTHCCAEEKKNPEECETGCKHHQYRWSWNFNQWWNWSFKYKLSRWFCIHIRCPIGRLRKPVPLEWASAYDGMRDVIILGGDPKCPHCGEMPYSYSECVFCGQRFIQNEKTRKVAEPPEEEIMDCFICGGKGTLKGHRAKINGHFRGKCEQCGVAVME